MKKPFKIPTILNIIYLKIGFDMNTLNPLNQISCFFRDYCEFFRDYIKETTTTMMEGRQVNFSFLRFD